MSACARPDSRQTARSACLPGSIEPIWSSAGELLAVCHSWRWAKEVAVGRPYADVAALQQAADRIWMSLSPEDWQ